MAILYKKIKMRNNLDIVLLSSVLFVYLLLHFVDIRLPIAVLTSPFLVLTVYRRTTLLKILLHSLPFIFFLGFYMLTFSNNYKNLLSSYRICYNCFSVLSLIVYSGHIILVLRNRELSYPRKLFIRQLLWINLLIALIFVSFFLIRTGLLVDISYSIMLIIKALVFSLLMLSFSYLFFMSKQRKSRVKKEKLAYGLNQKQIEEYGMKVEEFLENSNLFLNTNFNLSNLSKILNIPKHHLSICFTNYFGMNFYNLLAKHRIEYAINMAVKSPNLSWDSIAFDCGYCSRSTFNKHFKNYTGYLPSEIQLVDNGGIGYLSLGNRMTTIGKT